MLFESTACAHLYRRCICNSCKMRKMRTMRSFDRHRASNFQNKVKTEMQQQYRNCMAQSSARGREPPALKASNVRKVDLKPGSGASVLSFYARTKLERMQFLAQLIVDRLPEAESSSDCGTKLLCRILTCLFVKAAVNKHRISRAYMRKYSSNQVIDEGLRSGGHVL